jgi:hypothetical protein
MDIITATFDATQATRGLGYQVRLRILRFGTLDAFLLDDYRGVIGMGYSCIRTLIACTIARVWQRSDFLRQYIYVNLQAASSTTHLYV